MSYISKARQLFEAAGLAFPAIPEEMAERLKERGSWLFSTRDLEVSPYVLRHYLAEASRAGVKDYALIAHSGHGVNSYAVQYYLVHCGLRMFLHLGWGGFYSDAQADSAQIRECFHLADNLVELAHATELRPECGRLTVVASDFYGGYYEPLPALKQVTGDSLLFHLFELVRRLPTQKGERVDCPRGTRSHDRATSSDNASS